MASPWLEMDGKMMISEFLKSQVAPSQPAICHSLIGVIHKLQTSPMRPSDMLDLNHGFPCFIIHQGQLWLSTCAARRIYSSKSGSNGEHGFQGRLPTGWNEKTPEGLNAMVKPLRTFQPLGQWRWRKPLKTKKTSFSRFHPDSTLGV